MPVVSAFEAVEDDLVPLLAILCCVINLDISYWGALVVAVEVTAVELSF